MLGVFFWLSAVAMPSTATISISGSPDGEMLRIKDDFRMRPTDFRFTGYESPPGARVRVRADGDGTILLGTYSYDPREPRSIEIKKGQWTEVGDEFGGALWWRAPVAGRGYRLEIEGARSVPSFKRKGQWSEPLGGSVSESAYLEGRYLALMVRRASAVEHATDPASALSVLDRIVEIEDRLTGLRPLADGRPPTLMVEHPNDSPYMFATYYRTAYRSDTMKILLSGEKLRSDGWGPWHELGHMRQSNSWTWGELGEVTTNIFSREVERAFGQSSRLVRDGNAKAISDFLAQPERMYNSEKVSPFVRLGFFEELREQFGAGLYTRLYQLGRRMSPADRPETDEHRISYLAEHASRLSRTDLRPLFDRWGIRIPKATRVRIAGLGLRLWSPPK